MMKGLSPGAAFALLMGGPATNAATITMLGKSLGKRSLAAYLGSILFGAIFFGAIIDNLLPREWFSLEAAHAILHGSGGGHEGHETLPIWLKQGSSILLIALMVNGAIRRKLASSKQLGAEGTKACCASGSQCDSEIIKVMDDDKLARITVLAEGMTCNHCKKAVESNLLKLEGIDGVQADLTSGQVSIVGSHIEVGAVERVITELGYKFGGKVKK